MNHRVLTGITTTGTPHLGNYVGAIRPAVAASLGPDVDAFYFLADYHALIKCDDPARIERSRLEIAATWLAAGLDPERTTFYRQSDIPQIPELTWLLTCVTAKGLMNRAHAYKASVDANVAAGEDPDSGITMGLYSYPILMAADILLYDAAYVPVGEDQRQHLEITRDLAERFNQRFKKALRVPEPYIVKEGAKIMDLQEPTQKMSKSQSSELGMINLLDEPSRNAKKIKSAVTDSETVIRYDVENKPGVSNLLMIHSVLSGTPIPQLEDHFAGKQYGHLKVETADVLVDAVAPFRARTLELLDDPAELDRILASSADRAGEVAARTLARVYDKVGLLAPVRTYFL